MEYTWWSPGSKEEGRWMDGGYCVEIQLNFWSSKRLYSYAFEIDSLWRNYVRPYCRWPRDSASVSLQVRRFCPYGVSTLYSCIRLLFVCFISIIANELPWRRFLFFVAMFYIESVRRVYEFTTLFALQCHCVSKLTMNVKTSVGLEFTKAKLQSDYT